MRTHYKSRAPMIWPESTNPAGVTVVTSASIKNGFRLYREGFDLMAVCHVNFKQGIVNDHTKRDEKVGFSAMRRLWGMEDSVLFLGWEWA